MYQVWEELAMDVLHEQRKTTTIGSIWYNVARANVLRIAVLLVFLLMMNNARIYPIIHTCYGQAAQLHHVYAVCILRAIQISSIRAFFFKRTVYKWGDGVGVVH